MLETVVRALWQEYGFPALDAIFFYCTGAGVGVGILVTSFFTYNDKTQVKMYVAQGAVMTVVFAALQQRPFNRVAFTLGYSTPVCCLAFFGSVFDYGLWRNFGHSGAQFRKTYCNLSWPLAVMWAVRWLRQE